MESECEKVGYCTHVYEFFVWVLGDLKIWNGDDMIESFASNTLCSLLRKNNGVD